MRSSSRGRLRRPPLARSRAGAGAPAEEPAAIIPDLVPFEQLGLSSAVHSRVMEFGFETATPIQSGAIPPALEGRDVIGQAHTGSGKTLAFGIPLVERLDPSVGSIQALVLCPTRELAVQVHDELSRVSSARNLRCVALYGGDSMARQLRDLSQTVHIVVATPGRLVDHCQRRSVSLNAVRVAVLDEADRMLDMGFAPVVEGILRQCPAQRQTLLFSATMPQWVRRLAERHMRDPLTVALDVRPQVAPTVRQLYIQTPWADKAQTLSRLLDSARVEMALIFVETKRTADLLQVQIERRGHSIGVLHGDLSQRERDAALSAFVQRQIRYLIATNVAARGIHIDDISHVINFDVPTTPDEYLHRVGRTARAGRDGVAITLITPSEILKLRDVERHAHTHIEPAQLSDFDDPPEAVSA